MIIAVDFDGTLHSGKNWPKIGSPAPHAVEMMQRLKEDGHTLIIWTCREGQYRFDMEEWLICNKIPYDLVNENICNPFGAYGYNARKIYADVYIDNQNLGGLPTWIEIYDIISGKVKPFWLYKFNK